MNTTQAIERLNRAGAENSRATQKLHEAAGDVAQLIINIVPRATVLPRGYEVIRRKTNVGSADYLVNTHEEYVDGDGCYLHGDFNCWIPARNRETSLLFAKDIAEGLLEEITVWLESRKLESEQAAEVMKSKI